MRRSRDGSTKGRCRRRGARLRGFPALRFQAHRVQLNVDRPENPPHHVALACPTRVACLFPILSRAVQGFPLRTAATEETSQSAPVTDNPAARPAGLRRACRSRPKPRLRRLLFRPGRAGRARDSTSRPLAASDRRPLARSDAAVGGQQREVVAADPLGVAAKQEIDFRRKLVTAAPVLRRS